MPTPYSTMIPIGTTVLTTDLDARLSLNSGHAPHVSYTVSTVYFRQNIYRSLTAHQSISFLRLRKPRKTIPLLLKPKQMISMCSQYNSYPLHNSQPLFPSRGTICDSGQWRDSISAGKRRQFSLGDLERAEAIASH